jgi:YesN/AraC family two-component response regulator
MSDDKKIILIVDDEVHIVEILKTMLSPIVDEVFTAYNGKDGLDIVKKHPEIDVILSDIKMPIMDGISFIKNVRELKIDKPFVFFTGYGSEQYMMDALKYGAFDFLNKPHFESLEEIVLKALDHARNITKTSEDENETVTAYKKLMSTNKDGDE